MSIKIYVAWRCPTSKTNETITSVHNQMFNSAVKHLEDLMTNVKTDSFGVCPPHFKDNGGEEIWTKAKKVDSILEEVKKAAKSSMIDFFDIECGLNVWLYKNKTYFIPIAPRYMIKNLELPECCEEYAYWDDVDPPEDISSKVWNDRKKIWEEICLKNHNATRLYHTIIEAKTDFDLFDIRYHIAYNDLYKFLDSLKK